MTEIEQLRADIDQAKEIMLRFYKQDRQALGIGEMHDRLARLEAEEAEKADPWKYAKDAIPLHISNGGNRVSIVAKYAKHLEQRVAELEQHVAALKQAESIDIFDSKRAARQDARIAELEKQLASEKQQVHNVDSMAYVFLNDLEKAQARIAELKAEIARRPKVYCVKTHDGIATTGSRSKVPRVFLAESIEDEYGDGAQCIVPYTGQQS